MRFWTYATSMRSMCCSMSTKSKYHNAAVQRVFCGRSSFDRMSVVTAPLALRSAVVCF